MQIRGLVIGCALLAACDKKETKPTAEPVKGSATATPAATPTPAPKVDDSFWPDAPKATATTGTHTFRYKPENVPSYKLAASGGSSPGAAAKIGFSMSLDLSFKPGPKPRTTDVRIVRLDLDMDAAGQKTVMHLDKDEMMVQEGSQPPVRMKRGESSAIDIAGMTGKPFTNLVFTDDNTVQINSYKDHPFNTLGNSGDMFDNALVLFPDLPKQPVSPGHTWSMTRNTGVGGTGARVDITYKFQYVGDSACPSGAKSCGLFTFTAASKDATIEVSGQNAKVNFGAMGKVYFDHDKGVIDESRYKMDIDVAVGTIKMPVTGTYIVTPKA